MKTLEGKVGEAHTGLRMMPITTARLEKWIIYRTLYRVLRKVMLQQWEIMSPRLNTALIPPNKSSKQG